MDELNEIQALVASIQGASVSRGCLMLDAAIRAAVEAEREACAEWADSFERVWASDSKRVTVARKIAAAIRRRSPSKDRCDRQRQQEDMMDDPRSFLVNTLIGKGWLQEDAEDTVDEALRTAVETERERLLTWLVIEEYIAEQDAFAIRAQRTE